MPTEVNATMKQRGYTAAQWVGAQGDPILAAREVGLVTDTGRYVIGDGATVFSGLTLMGGDVATDLAPLMGGDLTTRGFGLAAPAGGSSVTSGLAVTPVAATMNSAVSEGGGWVSVGEGRVFPVRVDSAGETVTHDAAHGTNPRIDLVVARVQDAGDYSGAVDSITIEVVTGTPAASPADPAVPANSLTLARVRVPATATDAATFTYTDRRNFGKTVSVKSFGAVLDGTTDDTSAIRQALAGGATDVIIPPGGTARITGTLTVPVGVNLWCYSPVSYAGAGGEAAIVVGAAPTPNQRVRGYIDVTRATQSTWASEADVGVRLINAMEVTDLTVARAEGFTIGVQAIGNAGGFAYNTIKLGRLSSNFIGVDCAVSNGGYCNENVFIAGRFRVSTGVNTTSSRFGVRIGTAGQNISNNNLFIKPSFELNAGDTTGDTVGVWAENALDCRLESIRLETTTYAGRVGTYASNVAITIGNYGGGSLTATQLVNPENMGISIVIPSNAQLATQLVYRSPRFDKSWCYYDGSTEVHVPNVVWTRSTATTAFTNNSDGVTANAGASWLEIPTNRAVGVFVDTRFTRRFVALRDAEGTAGGRILVRPFDSAGAALGDGSYVTGNLSWNAGVNGFRSAADASSPVGFQVSTDVAYVFIGVIGGSAVAKLRALSVHTLDAAQATTWWTGYQDGESGNRAIAAPSAGTWPRGRIVTNDEPSASGTLGWVCTTAGTPGTWKTFGTISA